MPFEFSDLSLVALAVGALAFFVGGTVKGILGIGMPLVVVPILAFAMDPRVAVAMMTVPTLSSNLWLIIRGKRFGASLARFWTLFLMLVLATLVGLLLIVRVDPSVVSLVLGIAVILFVASRLLPFEPKISPRTERWMSPSVGSFAGLIGGVSNFFGPPLIAYFVALRLSKDEFVATIALAFVIGGLPLYGGLAVYSFLTAEVFVASAVAAVIALLGVAAGSRLRHRFSQTFFERLLLVFLFAMGLTLIQRGIF